MNITEITSMSGFNAAAIKRPMSVVFFYKSDYMSRATFFSEIENLCRYASSLCVKNLCFFQTNELPHILDDHFKVYVQHGVLVFRDGNLLDYMESFNRKDFELILNYPSTQSCLSVPIDNDTKMAKKILREERAKGVVVWKVKVNPARGKVIIYHDASNMTVRDLKRVADVCVGTDEDEVVVDTKAQSTSEQQHQGACCLLL